MLVVRNFKDAASYLELMEAFIDGGFVGFEPILDSYEDDEFSEILATNRAKEISGVCVRVSNFNENLNSWDGPVVVNYLN